MGNFAGQTVLISGATRGIGGAIAKAFLGQGAALIGLYGSNTKAAEEFVRENHQYRGRISLHQCDIKDEKQVVSLFEYIEREYGRLDVLVNNAGIRKDGLLALMKPEDWKSVIDTNLNGTYLMSRQAVMLMMQHKYGRIINITSPVGRLGFPGQANYAASKAGQVAMTKSLAKEVARKKITVNCISPGFIDTDFIRDLPEQQLKEYKKMVPVRRFGTPEEVAEAVLFLAGKTSGYITGTVLEISGGL
ncbi:SDR family oxidoreductase [Desulforhopalus singaporensis]|uniref:3-oxoacyl-[acyl-carrier-protein] reductase n=1 Tax=Desulforhopalus singaporensis TaxID=91360 RepID=A0A1H0PVD4_9BACT|nr:SDR family NAD(P)-dependent oxidoreductase [Desulforhopalus singaporensis]SDP09063.1 3-oxoacyl-[acyl-carrier-protein] reductase [Desulforhopalus singaporensis]